MKKYRKRFKVGQKVIIYGVVEKMDDSAYAEVRIDDGICGIRNVRLTVHQEAIEAQPRKKPKKQHIMTPFELRALALDQYIMHKSTHH